MKKKIVLISIFVIFSVICSIGNSENIFITDSKTIISLLFTLLGLSFTSFSFISTSITGVITKLNTSYCEDVVSGLNKMLNSIREDILLILFLILVLILINLLYSIDIPFFSDALNIDLCVFKIVSFKKMLHNFATSLACCFAMYAFYDIFDAAFVLIKGYYNISIKKI